MARFTFGAPLTPLPSSAGFAQNFPAKALSFASHLIAALSGGNVISDVMLTRRVTWIDGSDTETGAATSLGLAWGESRINFALPNRTRTEIVKPPGESPTGIGSRKKAFRDLSASQNCGVL